MWSMRRSIRDDLLGSSLKRVDVIARVYEALSPKCQKVCALRMLEYRPFEEAGRVMGISDRMAKNLCGSGACLDAGRA